MAAITLANDFHGTSIRLLPREDILSARQVARSRRTLCGVDGCLCGGHAGERGPQWGPGASRIYLEPYGSGRLLVCADVPSCRE